jgi:hypothetical protein
MEDGAVGHNFERDPPGTIPVRFGLIWFSGFRGEDLNMIFYQNMPNLHNRYKSAERNSQNNPEYMCKYSTIPTKFNGNTPPYHQSLMEILHHTTKV